MGLPVLTTWTNFADVVAHTVEGQELLSANNYTAFESLVEKLANSNGYTFCQETLVKTGAEVSEIGSTTKLMTYTEFATEGATGGVATATEVASLAETETGVTATTVGASAGAVSVGAIVGGVIGGMGLGLLAYELTPEFWTGVSNAIFGTDIEYDNIEDYSLMTLFKDNKTYVASDTVTKINNYLMSIGAYNTNQQTNINTDNLIVGQQCPITYNKPFTPNDLTNLANKLYSYDTPNFTKYVDIRTISDGIFSMLANHVGTNGLLNPYLYDYTFVNISIGEEVETGSCYEFVDFNFANSIEGNHVATILSKNQNSFNNDYYMCNIPITIGSKKKCTISITYNAQGVPSYGLSSYNVSDSTTDLLKNIPIGYYTLLTNCQFSNINTTTIILPNYNGLTHQQNATLPQSNTPLSTTFPNWYANALNIGGIKPDKSGLQQVQFLPIELPSVNPMTTDLTAPQAQAQLGDVTTPQQQQAILDALQRLQYSIPNYPVIQNPPSTDVGNTPTPQPITPSAHASGLISIYNPTLTEIKSFGGYLWSTGFIDQILKLFQNPMDAIIGLHILYGTPITDGVGNIKVGYLDSQVSSKLVSNQYITIDCGLVSVPEYNGNATDYPPYTRISLYLPFIGIVELNAYDIVGGSVNITYKIDVLTGCCLATVKVTKNSSDAILYTYNGNCAVQLPLTGGNYASVVSGLIGVGIGAMTGGVGMAVAGVMGAVSHGATVQHSGCLGSNSGAMGIKKPYLIVTRFVPYDAVNYNNYYGYPSNITQKISSLTGFTKVKEIRLNGITATNKEKLELETILKKGVIF